MLYFIALLILVLVYVVVKFLLGKVESLVPIAEVLAVIAGIIAALLYARAI